MEQRTPTHLAPMASLLYNPDGHEQAGSRRQDAHPHMNIAQRRVLRMPHGEYLDGEKDCPIRHEYVDGTIYAIMKVGISATGPFYCPDVVVTCDERDRQSNYVKYHPKLIVEVLPPRSSFIDRGDNLNDYCSLPSMEEYLLVGQDKLHVECVRCAPEGEWEEFVYGPGDEIHLASIGTSFPIQQAYDRVHFEGYQPLPGLAGSTLYTPRAPQVRPGSIGQ